MDIKEIFKDNGILKKKNKNYKKRVSQIKVAILLEKAIKDKKTLYTRRSLWYIVTLYNV